MSVVAVTTHAYHAVKVLYKKSVLPVAVGIQVECGPSPLEVNAATAIW